MLSIHELLGDVPDPSHNIPQSISVKVVVSLELSKRVVQPIYPDRFPFLIDLFVDANMIKSMCHCFWVVFGLFTSTLSMLLSSSVEWVVGKRLLDECAHYWASWDR